MTQDTVGARCHSTASMRGITPDGDTVLERGSRKGLKIDDIAADYGVGAVLLYLAVVRPDIFGRIGEGDAVHRIVFCAGGAGFSHMTPGTAIFSVSFGSPTKPWNIVERAFEGGLFRVILSDGRLRVEVMERAADGSLRAVWSVVSCPVIAEAPTPTEIVLKWSDGGLSVEVEDGKLVASTDPAVTIPPSLTLRQKSFADTFEDFSERNAASVVARADRLANAGKWNDDRKYPGKDFDLERLGKERAALVDFLRLVRGGADYHDLSIAKAVRTLLIPIKKKNQMGLLQRCAAHLNAQVIVYTLAQPSLRLPMPADFMLYVAISGAPEDIFRNPVDIDEWLQLPAAVVAGTEYTNHDFIAAIGDTRATHADPGWHALVEAIETMRTDAHHSGGANQNFLTYTILQIGDAVASASGQLLREARQ